MEELPGDHVDGASHAPAPSSPCGQEALGVLRGRAP